MCTILGSEILNVQTFWKTLFLLDLSLKAILEINLSTNANSQKRSFGMILQRMVSISSVEATNHQYQVHQLQASNTISFASLSAHCHHSDCSDWSVVHLGKIPKRQQNKETFWWMTYIWKIIWIWRLCVLATTTTKSHILCPFQVLKEELHWNRIEQKKKKNETKKKYVKKATMTTWFGQCRADLSAILLIQSDQWLKYQTKKHNDSLWFYLW